MSKLSSCRHWLVILAVLILMGVAVIVSPGPHTLRKIYSGPVEDWPEPWLDPGVTYRELAAAAFPPPPQAGTAEAKMADLGRRLFEDPALSDSGHFSCQSCHNRRLGWGDGLPHSFGHGRAEGTRNAPSLFAAWARPALFWDGRAASLEEQAMGPLGASNEMANHDLAAVARRLEQSEDYQTLFRDAFGDEEIRIDRIAAALAEYERHLDRPSDLDRFLSGQAERLTDQQIEGLHLFRTKARCLNCHMGQALMDGEFHNLGLAYYRRKYEDLGRYEVTGDPQDAGAFLTPSLRHVEKTAPYMHNGLFPSLSGIVGFYNAGGAVQDIDPEAAATDPLYGPAMTPSSLLRPLGLSVSEQAALVAFLRAL